MAYSIQADVDRAAGGTANLIALTDLDGDGSIDATVLAEAINDADRLIDSYLARRYAVPLDEVSDIIRRISAQESVYFLKDSRDAIDERAERRHTENLEWLEGVAAGSINPGVDPAPNKSSAVAAKTGDRIGFEGFQTRESLKGFW